MSPLIATSLLDHIAMVDLMSRRFILVIVALTSLTLSGCGLAVPFGATGSTPDRNPAPQSPLISVEQMRSAPVPSVCDQPAGRLKDGTLGTPGAGSGGVAIATYGADRKPAFLAWRTPDGTPYAALVVDCNQGGVGWPPHVIFYSAGPRVLGEVDVADVVGNGRQSVEAMVPTTNGVRLSLANTYASGEDGCCGSVDSIADFTWNGTQAKGTVVKKLTEESTAKAAFFAALTGDRATIEKLYNAEGKAEALEFKNTALVPNPNDWDTKFTCGSAVEDELFSGEGRSYERVCYFGAKDAYVAAFVAMTHTGFGTWQSAGVQLTTTD